MGCCPPFWKTRDYNRDGKLTDFMGHWAWDEARGDWVWHSVGDTIPRSLGKSQKPRKPRSA